MAASPARPLHLATAFLISLACATGSAVAQQDPANTRQSPANFEQNNVPDDPTLIVRITPPKPYLQEEIVQVIRLIAPHPFEELVLDLPPIEGTEIITLQQPKNRKFQTYGGEGYIYETSRAIFPKASGPLHIPPVRISGSVGISRNEKKPFALRSDATTLEVRPPNASFSEDWWLIARDVTVEEGWSKPLDELRVGDHVIRRVAVTVAGVTGAHLPELEQGRSPGLTVLPGRTERRTEVTSGGVIGKISRSFDIRIDNDQPINISPVRVVWWNTGTEIERRTTAPAVRIEPLPRDVDKLVSTLMEEAEATQERSWRGITGMALGMLAALAGAVFWLLRFSRRARAEDRALHRSLSADDTPTGAIRALLAWGEAIFPEQRPASLTHISQKLGPDVEKRINRLQRAVFDRGQDIVDTRGLVSEILQLAEDRNRKPLKTLLVGWMDRLLGPMRKLPPLDDHHWPKNRYR